MYVPYFDTSCNGFIAMYMYVTRLSNQYLLQNGSTPLHWASAYGKTTVIEFLIRKGANSNVKNNVRTYTN